MSTSITVESNIPPDEVHNGEQETLIPPVLPTKATDGAVESDSESFSNKNDLSTKEPAKTTRSDKTKVNLSPTAAKKRTEICKF